MKSHGRLWLGLVLLCGLAATLEAYELRTHEQMTNAAIDRSSGFRNYLEDVGLKPEDQFQVPGSTGPFDDRPPGTPDQLALFENTRTARDWMREGAIREDDYQRHPALEFLGCSPPPNPPTLIDRMTNHFFDVQRGGGGLRIPLVVNGTPASDWALGRVGRGPADNQNHFTLLDARDYQLKSLTAAPRAEREQNTALLFRTLGHVGHLIQDMGQPQHTRNDPHTGCLGNLGGERSWYEWYYEWVARGQQAALRANALPLGGYGPAQLTDYQHFFSAPGNRGLADFSSRNFFTVGTNLPDDPTLPPQFRCGGLANPTCQPNAYRQVEETITIPLTRDRVATGTAIIFLADMIDQLTGETIAGVKVSARSLWDQFRGLKNQTQQGPEFTLTSANYDSIGGVLIPRAVGYSAGFLDYFFRGRLEPVFTANPTAPATSLLKVVNRSEVDPLGGGTLSVHVDDASGVRTNVGEASIGATQPGLTSEAGIVVDPSLEARAVTVVYQGALGGEAGAVIGKVQPAAAVEQIFRGGSDWMLRTATGIFPLGLGLPPVGPEVVKWGDVDNTLVTQAFIGILDMRFQAYRIKRAEGSRTVPLTAVRTVDLISLGDPVTLGPTPIDLGTTWTDQRVVDYEQTVVALARDTNGVVSFLGTDPGYTTTMDRTRPLRLTMPLDDQSPDYDWSLLDFALNRGGEVVGLVYVRIGAPPLVEVPVLRHQGDGTIGNSGQIGSVDFFTGLRNDCWFIVNLTRRIVVGKTCDDTVQTSHRARQQGTLVYDLRDVGGNWVPLFTVAPLGDEPEVGTFAIDHGVTGVSRTGVYRREWTTAGYGTVQVGSQASSGLVAFSTDFFPARRLRAVVRGSSTSHDVEVVTILGELRRSDGPAEGYTVLAADSRFVEEREFIQAWQWRPLTGGLTPLASLSVPANPGVFVTTHLVDANRTAGMLLTTIFTFPRQRQTRIVSTARELVFSEALQSQYDLLEPGLLYGLIDLRFHRQGQALEALTAPDPLAAGGPTTGAYHVVGRR
ncbi:MAG TPA: hypothetical protein VGV06_15635 [Methylomirabilota bacterium]|nr:hypothetical protein [Methylomirabilota bacterium]